MDKKQAKVEIRQATLEEAINFTLYQAGVEQWASYQNFEPYYNFDKDAFPILYVDGKPAACITSFKYGSYGFVGYYICIPEFRGKGYGKQLWDFAHKRIEGCKSVGLDGVIAQVPNYEKSGYKAFCDTIRHQWTATNQKFDQNSFSYCLIKNNYQDISKMLELVKLDLELFGYDRKDLLTGLSKNDKNIFAGVYKNGALVGYGVAQPNQAGGYKIGPVVARSSDAGQNLILYIQNQTAGSVVYMDILSKNQASMYLAKQLGSEQTFFMMRMYKGETPKQDPNTLFAVNCEFA